MVRALFTVADGGYSHLYPLIPIARGLRGRGHGVAFSGPARLMKIAAADGFETIALPESPATARGDGTAASLPSVRKARSAVQRYLDDAVRHTAFVRSTAADWSADVFVRESAAWAGWLAGELAGLPVALFDYAPTPPRLLALMLGDLFGEARARVGLPPDPDLATLHRWLHLLAGPPGWFPARAIGPATHLLQPPAPLELDCVMPDWLAELGAGRPCVYVTLGTMFDSGSGVYEMIFEALADLELSAVATLGPATPPERFADVPANVRLERFLPQAVEAAVLSRVDAVICHGGYGSIVGALRHGLPIVSIPAGNADDPTRVPALAGLGAAVTVPDERRCADAVRTALDTVLTDPRYRDAARDAAASMATLPPFTRAAELVERLAGERQPVLRG